jgi:cellulose synthase/poly-beta-1,6-N-acetylglucosamine synthase-like glycosyltransferase
MTMTIVNLLLTLLAVALFVPAAVFFLECFVAMGVNLRRRRAVNQGPRPTIGVIMPAHNEAAVIGYTIKALKPQLQAGDRLLVVADNCTDKTAAIARAAGADVIERFDEQKRGKGFALGFGVRELAKCPPQVVMIIDADCAVDPGSVTVLARQAGTYRCAVQALYVMKPPPAEVAGAMDFVSALAFTIHNEARPVGAWALGGPCQLMGTGMAMPWSVAKQVTWDTGDIVEDMAMGLELAMNGKPPLFCPEAKVVGVLPGQRSAAKSQRTRWEHGHLHTLLSRGPRLVGAAWRQKREDLLDLLLDLLVPPLSLLAALVGAVAVVTVTAALMGAWWYPAMISLTALVMMAIAVIGCWYKFARREVPLTGLLAAPLYVAWKLPIYAAFLVKRQTAWIRTAR